MQWTGFRLHPPEGRADRSAGFPVPRLWPGFPDEKQRPGSSPRSVPSLPPPSASPQPPSPSPPPPTPSPPPPSPSPPPPLPSRPPPPLPPPPSPPPSPPPPSPPMNCSNPCGFANNLTCYDFFEKVSCGHSAGCTCRRSTPRLNGLLGWALRLQAAPHTRHERLSRPGPAWEAAVVQPRGPGQVAHPAVFNAQVTSPIWAASAADAAWIRARPLSRPRHPRYPRRRRAPPHPRRRRHPHTHPLVFRAWSPGCRP